MWADAITGTVSACTTLAALLEELELPVPVLMLLGLLEQRLWILGHLRYQPVVQERHVWQVQLAACFAIVLGAPSSLQLKQGVAYEAMS